MVGRITGAHTFDPKYATLIQNKDDLRIPLLLETIPTPKQFRDAIESLSPEQQRFCKGFRAMQLESTLFGVCVIQIKPALEKLLNLPDDALTKEIELVQDIMKLFLEYQIPSDQLSWAPGMQLPDPAPVAVSAGDEKKAVPPAAVKPAVPAIAKGPGADRVAIVRVLVDRMLDLTERQKQKELEVSPVASPPSHAQCSSDPAALLC